MLLTQSTTKEWNEKDDHYLVAVAVVREMQRMTELPNLVAKRQKTKVVVLVDWRAAQRLSLKCRPFPQVNPRLQTLSKRKPDVLVRRLNGQSHVPL